MEKYWEQALTFAEYFEQAKHRAENAPAEDPYKEYYSLGVQRMNRTLKTLKHDKNLTAELTAKHFTGKVLIISEPWCGDASSTVPALVSYLEAAGTEVRIFLRDQDTTLIDQYLTNGGRSIPKVLILNKDRTVKAVWGPRPAHGRELYLKFQTDPQKYSKEDFYNDLQVYYAKNGGKDAMREVLELL